MYDFTTLARIQAAQCLLRDSLSVAESLWWALGVWLTEVTHATLGMCMGLPEYLSTSNAPYPVDITHSVHITKISVYFWNLNK
jgi:hypothetical protein